MKWLKKILDIILRNNKIKYLEEAKPVKQTEEIKNDFKIIMKQTANLECNEGNGYKIAPILELKDMV